MQPIRTTATTGSTLLERWLATAASWVANQPTASHPSGLARVCDALLVWLDGLGFCVRVHAQHGAAPIIVALRSPEAGVRWVGLSAHYDVEEGGEGWSSNPFVVRVAGSRAYGRGVGDNLGPLVLRLLALEGTIGNHDQGADREHTALPGLAWVIQGQEEIGSPWAHALFPRLELPEIALWMEETGYFEHDGAQRILARRIPAHLAAVLESVTGLARAEGRNVRVWDRYLNKAFGESRCPCLTHLVREAPYLAIGPNDTQTRIHLSDESLPLDTLELASAQFIRVLHEVARCA